MRIHSQRCFRRLPYLSLLAAGLLLAGCAPHSYVTLLESPDGSIGKVIVTGNRGSSTIEQPRFGAELDGSSQELFAVSEARIQQDFGAALAAQPLLPRRFLLYFETGGTRLTPESEKLIPDILAEIRNRPAADISVIGHTDTLGEADRNELLALARAGFVEQLLAKQDLKVRDITVSSHGEKNLLVPTADNTSEPLNRRVEISVR